MMLIMFLGVTPMFTSCSDDDSHENNSMLYGTWEVISRQCYKDGQVVSNKNVTSTKWVFKKNGTLLHVIGSSIDEGTYGCSGNFLSLKYHVDMGDMKSWDENYKVEIIELSESKLVWKKMYNDDEYDFEMYTLSKTTSQFDE